MTLLFLDLETTGLDPTRHHVWEAAWAVNDEPINATFVGHSLVGADEKALEIGGYWDRFDGTLVDVDQELALRRVLEGATIVGANPAFDAGFLNARWGQSPWHYRLLDIETYAMPALGADRPVGLAKIHDHLTGRGFDIPNPDHTAGGDVDCLRACHQALTYIYDGETPTEGDRITAAHLDFGGEPAEAQMVRAQAGDCA